MCDKTTVFIVYEECLNPQTGFIMYTRNLEVHCDKADAYEAADKLNKETSLATVKHKVDEVKLVNDNPKS